MAGVAFEFFGTQHFRFASFSLTATPTFM